MVTTINQKHPANPALNSALPLLVVAILCLSTTGCDDISGPQSTRTSFTGYTMAQVVGQWRGVISGGWGSGSLDDSISIMIDESARLRGRTDASHDTIIADLALNPENGCLSGNGYLGHEEFIWHLYQESDLPRSDRLKIEGTLSEVVLFAVMTRYRVELWKDIIP